MNVLSDTDSSDSDTGRRFKTESTRVRENQSDRFIDRKESSSSTSVRKEYRRYRSKSKSRSRSRERSTRRRSRSREKSHRKYEKKRRDSRDQRQNESRDRDKERSKDRDRYHSSTSKPSDKHKSHKKSHSKVSGADKKDDYKNKSQNSDTAADVSDRPKKHKKDKVKDKHKDREEPTSRATDVEHRRSSEQQPEAHEISHKQHADVTIEKNGTSEMQSDADENLMCGPSLPPHMLKSGQGNSSDDRETKPVEKQYGPSLPSDFAPNSQYSASSTELKTDVDVDADVNDKEISESDDDEFIGPVLDHMTNKSEAHLELEKRALELKLAKLNEREQKDVSSIRGREEWMMELPELRTVADLGLSARSFRTKERDEIKDRSSWTETPRDREEKSKSKGSSHEDTVKRRQREAEKLHLQRRDAEQEAAIRKHKKKCKRDESLLEMHQKKLKKSAQKTDEPTERRPFSRETDLKVNRFDEAQKKSILKKAQLLDTRFGSGQSKYL